MTEMTTAHVNRIATAVPVRDVHRAFVDYARTFLENRGDRAVFDRLVTKPQIGHRYAIFAPAADPTGDSVDAEHFYSRGCFRARRYKAPTKAKVT